MSNVTDAARAAKRAVGSLVGLTSAQKKDLLLAIADGLEAGAQKIQAANAIDIKNCTGKTDAFIDRLRFDGGRIRSAADGLRKLVELSDPVGRTVEDRTLYNGLKLKKVTVPMGVIAIIYEARPNVTVDAAGLCLKSSNATVLRGSNDAINTNRATVSIIRETLKAHGVDENAVTLAECDHDGVRALLSDRENIDLAIPRGSKTLINFVRDTAKVPVIETGAGNCSAYIDGTYDVKKAVDIVINAKTQRISVCNALESLYIRRDAIDSALPVLEALTAAGVTVHGDGEICAAYKAAVPADEEDFYREYLSMDISAKVVSGVKEAVECINGYGTHHSDAILSRNDSDIEYFCSHVDSAAVYVNASTRFTDGGEFGLGAEIGISTQKLHARGPMGLDEIVTYKYVVCGDGQIRK